ncbi:MAG: hypothetical protein KKG84_05730, partial [Candidatus Omnitrophica bacterium]|nr:hypothetical protein [Candidatus Omnitrophota bacterium]
MKTYKRNGYIVRVISLTVAIAFFFEQLVWAGDMILSPPIDPELPLYPDIDIAYGYAETIVKTKQGIEDFVHVNIGDDDEGQGPGEEISSLGFSDAPELSVEVSEGSVVFYSNGNASRIERPDGTIIRFIDTGENTVTLSDGTVYVWGGDDDGGHFAKGMG